jgi:hypothetical protein
MFWRVALRVNREIGQDPWISASTLPEVYFARKKPEGPTPEQLIEMACWASVKDNTDPAVLKTYLERYPNGAFAPAGAALIEQQEQRLKAEAAAREEQRKRAEEARKAAELRRKEDERKAREAKLAEERRRAEEERNSAEASRVAEQQRAEALAQAEELRKAYAELQAAREAVKSAGEQRVAMVKAAEAAQQTAKTALATQPDLKPGIRPPVHLDVQAGGLLTEKDAKRVKTHADKYGIPLPDFQIGVPGDDVPARWRHFLGVWDTDKSTSRRIVLIVTQVDKAGAADGFICFGPQRSDAHPSTRTPPGIMKIVGRISDDTRRFSDPDGANYNKLTLMNTNRLSYFFSNSAGASRSATFSSLWRLVEAERSGRR